VLSKGISRQESGPPTGACCCASQSRALKVSPLKFLNEKANSRKGFTQQNRAKTNGEIQKLSGFAV
jgi:hypothetical protein